MFARVGGKSKSKKYIISKIPKHSTYVEPFVGGGSIFFGKEKADINVINDKDKDIYHFYQDMKDVGDKMKDKTFEPNRTKFNKLVKKKSFSSKIERLYRNIYVSLMSFAGKRNTYIGDKKEEQLKQNTEVGKKYKTSKWKDFLQDVKIYNKDYKQIIKKYDGKDTFFFLDPPYSKGQKNWNYVDSLTPENILKVLKSIKGKFIMTYDDTTKNRKIFKDFKIKGYNVVYEISGKRTEVNKEILIMNY